MIEKVCTFPNQAIPSIYGESLSYTQVVAYLQYKVNECIEQLNNIASASLPLVNEQNNGWILQVENGNWTAANVLNPLESRVFSNENSIRFQGNQIAAINETLDGVAQMIATINGETL